MLEVFLCRKHKSKNHTSTHICATKEERLTAEHDFPPPVYFRQRLHVADGSGGDGRGGHHHDVEAEDVEVRVPHGAQLGEAGGDHAQHVAGRGGAVERQGGHLLVDLLNRGRGDLGDEVREADVEVVEGEVAREFARGLVGVEEVIRDFSVEAVQQQTDIDLHQLHPRAAHALQGGLEGGLRLPPHLSPPLGGETDLHTRARWNEEMS